MVSKGYLDEATRNEIVAVGTTSTQISFKKNRKVIYIRNSSTAGQTITVNMGPNTAVANTGIILDVGEFIVDSDIAGYQCYKDTITAISSAAGGQLSIFER